MTTEPAGQHTVRRLNSAMVLAEIAGNAGISRAELAARTGLAKATVSAQVDRLAAARIVAEGEPVRRAARGRRASGLSLSPHGPHGLGVEIAVDYLAVQLVDLSGQVRFQRIRNGDNRTRTPRRVLAAVAKLIDTAIRAAADLDVTVGGIGVAVPGLIEDGGRLRSAPNLGWRDLDLAGELAARLVHHTDRTAPIEVGNEADLAALAEWQRTRRPDFVRVSGEIGIGAGVVLDNTVYRGVRGFAGEIGHVCVAPGGATCRCGAVGCLETVAGQEAILRSAGVWDDGEPQPRLLALLCERLRAEDTVATRAVAEAGRLLGVALAAMVNVLDVPSLVLGGTYAELEPWLRDPVLAELRDRVPGTVTVARSALDTYAAAYGGAIGAVRAIIADPERVCG